jgi:hypothetical protein
LRYLKASEFHGNWTGSSSLRLDDISTHERSLEIQICVFMGLLREFGLNFWLGLLRIGLINEFDHGLRP